MSSFIDALRDFHERKETGKMTLKEAEQEYPNDYDLANYFAANYKKMMDLDESEGTQILKEHPNFYELGSFLRNKFTGGSN